MLGVDTAGNQTTAQTALLFLFSSVHLLGPGLLLGYKGSDYDALMTQTCCLCFFILAWLSQYTHLPCHHTCLASQKPGLQWLVSWGQQTEAGGFSRGSCLGAWLVPSPLLWVLCRLAAAADAEAATGINSITKSFWLKQVFNQGWVQRDSLGSVHNYTFSDNGACAWLLVK